MGDVMSKNAISLKHVTKNYQTNDIVIEVIKDLTIDFEYGKLYAIMGHSGVGKSTLIRILGLLDSVTDGEYYLTGKLVSNLSDNQCSEYRNKKIGFIFQDYNLDGYLKAYENVLLPMCINPKYKGTNKKARAKELLEELNLGDRIEHFPRELSGGEQQRVAIARALANNPDIILADEPTGNLDEENEKIIFEKLQQECKKGKCVIIVSHSSEVKKYADKVLEIKNYQIKEII